MDTQLQIDELRRRLDTHSHTVSDHTTKIPFQFSQVAGAVRSNGTENYLRPGWTSTSTGNGVYVVTHNLGTTNYMVVATENAGQKVVATVGTKTSTSFTVNTTSVTTGNAFNAGFDFLVIIYNTFGII